MLATSGEVMLATLLALTNLAPTVLHLAFLFYNLWVSGVWFVDGNMLTHVQKQAFEDNGDLHLQPLNRLHTKRLVVWLTTQGGCMLRYLCALGVRLRIL